MSNRFLRLPLVALYLSCSTIAFAGDPCGGNPDAWGPVTVGVGGLENDCTTPSLQTAISLATDPSQCYSNEVRVMRDAPEAGATFFNGGRILIRDKDVAVVGGWVNHPGTCVLQQATPGNVYTIIDGAGGGTDSVFQIEGNSSVRLSRLTIQNGGDPSSDFGGGIDFTGNGHLFLDHIDLAFNSAARGGGIALRGGNISAYFEDRVWILQNASVFDGGGIYVADNVKLEWTGNDAILWSNIAGRDGGGLYVGARTTVVLTPRGEIYPPTGTYHPVISGNHANRNGGGIAVNATSGSSSFDSSRLVMGAHHGANAQFVANNIAVANGGGLYMKSNDPAEGLHEANICLRGTTIVNNEALRGAAVYVETDGEAGGDFKLLGPTQCAVRSVPTCKGCNVIYNNRSTEGSVIQAESYANEIEISHTVISGNTGTNLISTERHSLITLTRNLIALNTSEQSLIGTYDEPRWVRFNHNTIADNVIYSNRVIETDLFNTTNNSEISRNIIWQPGKEAVGSPFPIPDGLVHQNLSNDGALQLMGPWNLVQSTSVDLFDPSQAYFPAANSKALDWGDYEPALSPELYPDLALKPIKDLMTAPGRGSATAIADLGAYERQTEAPSEDIFSDSFESN